MCKRAFAVIGIMLLAGSLAAQVPVDVTRELQLMEVSRDRYSPERLLTLEVDGLRAVYDSLLPESKQPRTVTKAATATAEEIAAWLTQLGDESYNVREQAMQALTQQGLAIRETIEQAQSSSDPEVKQRAKLILRTWDKPLRATDDDSLHALLPGLQVYLRGLSGAESLSLLADRTANLLTHRFEDDSSVHGVVREGLRRIAKTGDDELCERFLPYLQHEDSTLAVTVAEGLCLGRNADHFPKFLLLTLESKHDAIVLAGVKAVSPCNDLASRAAVQERLLKICKTRKHELRIQASVPLLSQFNDEHARTLLIDELAAADAARGRRALYLLQQASQPGEPAPAALLKNLEPWLVEADHDVRLQAARTLLKYSGEDVMRRAIPLLVDRKALLVDEVEKALRAKPDQEMLARMVKEATEANADPAFVKAAHALLQPRGFRSRPTPPPTSPDQPF